MIEQLQFALRGKAPGAPDAVGLLLSHADDSVRTRAIRLLATSKMTNAPVSMPILRYLQRSMALWFRPGGSHQRGELLSVIKRLLIRLRGGSSTLGNSVKSSSLDLDLLEAHKKFMETIITSVTQEIRPNVSYERRIMGLSILRFLLDFAIDSCDRTSDQQSDVRVLATSSTGRNVRGASKTSNDPNWPFSLCLRKMSIAQDLLNLASDAYEDVRTLSVSILRHLLVTGNDNGHSKFYSQQLHAAIAQLIPKLETQAALTNRSDHADGLGRLYALLELARESARDNGHPADSAPETVFIRLIGRLERILKTTSTFSRPDPEPLHSLLLGLMYCITDANAVNNQDRVISICRHVWRAVTDRLCIDSPEMTDEDANEPEEVASGPKDMLSYSWRALRDSR